MRLARRCAPIGNLAHLFIWPRRSLIQASNIPMEIAPFRLQRIGPSTSPLCSNCLLDLLPPCRWAIHAFALLTFLDDRPRRSSASAAASWRALNRNPWARQVFPSRAWSSRHGEVTTKICSIFVWRRRRKRQHHVRLGRVERRRQHASV